MPWVTGGFNDLHYSTAFELEEGALGAEMKREEIQIMESTHLVTKKHQERFKCGRCGKGLGFGPVEYKIEVAYHPGCVNPPPPPPKKRPRKKRVYKERWWETQLKKSRNQNEQE